MRNAIVVTRTMVAGELREDRSVPLSEELARRFARQQIADGKAHEERGFGKVEVSIEILEPAVALVHGGDIEELSHFATANRAAVLEHLSSEQKDALILNAARVIEQQRDGIEARDEQIDQLTADLKDVQADRGAR